jgi:FdhD protein
MKNSAMDGGRVRKVEVTRINGSTESRDADLLAAEEPLEIRVEGRSIAVVMRTPGEDRELAAGFLVTEGLVRMAGDLADIRHSPLCLGSNGENGALEGNVIDVRLKQPESVDFQKLTRHVFSSSSCGVCSKASIKAVRQQFPPIEDAFQFETEVLHGLTSALASTQETFKRTGGLHACGLFNAAGKLLVVREDVGRHNALDKVVGWALLSHRLPLRGHILLLSGRASFEMLQKALAAGIPVVAAISAPSSLAVEFARESGQTLVGFLRGERMNVYTGAERLLR